jgi:hypothetical protein
MKLKGLATSHLDRQEKDQMFLVKNDWKKPYFDKARHLATPYKTALAKTN